MLEECGYDPPAWKEREEGYERVEETDGKPLSVLALYVDFCEKISLRII
jgi:hypothetical protein